jgi:hypothetical protein
MMWRDVIYQRSHRISMRRRDFVTSTPTAASIATDEAIGLSGMVLGPGLTAPVAWQGHV